VRLRRIAFTAVLTVALATVLTFLLLPVLAVFLDVPLGRLLDQLGSEVALDAFWVTLKTNVIANALILGFGTPAAYFLATRRFRGRPVVITLVELPLVLPPAVAGIALIVAFGNLGIVGERIPVLAVEVGTQTAVVLAVTFVASPFYLRGAIAAFEALDRTLLDASRTLGAGPARTFFRVALPLAAGGLGAGAALAFARGVGEFGATIMFAGSLQGVTQTLSLAIYEQFDVNFEVALAISAFMVIFSGALLLAIKIVPSWARSGLPLAFPSAPSSSS
jgi:molybdate transport system permease protein